MMKYFLASSTILLQTGVADFLMAQPKKSDNSEMGLQAGVWKDTDGKFINAHGGGILEHKGVYYWFGEIKKGKTWLVSGQNWECYRVPAGGISCYSSRDLKRWKYEGVSLAATTGNPKSDLDTANVIERPKVIFNEKTGKFIMWMHIDHNDYSFAHAGVAFSDSPTGPYRYIESVKPNGHDSRDMTLFKDDDGTAYLIHSSENNNTMHINLLSQDYLRVTDKYIRILENQRREAPALFKYAGRYYLVTSDCSGWSPNPATYAVADSPLGSWKQRGNPCIGSGAETTFQSQSTYIVPIDAKKGKFLFMADRWNKTNLEDSRYVWLPLTALPDVVSIKWQKSRP